MYIDDSQKQKNKVYREHTPNILEDRKNCQQGLQIKNQDNEGQYTYANIGDEACWAYWASGTTSNPISPPAQENKEIHASEYMQKLEFQQAPISRKLGSWAQIIPVCSRPEGLFPIRSQDGNIDPQYRGKELVDEEGHDKKKVKNINGCHVPHGHPGILVQCANQDEHQQFFVPSGGIFSIDHKKSGLSTKIFQVDSDGWIDYEHPSSLDSIFRMGMKNDGEMTLGINFTKAGKDTLGYGTFIYHTESGKNIICPSSQELQGPFIHGHDEFEKHVIGTASNGDITQPLHISTNAYYYMDYERDSKLPFENKYCPVLQDPAEIEFYTPVHLGYQTSSQSWKWYVAMSTGTEMLTIARIQWNYNQIKDMSCAETVTYNPETGIYTGTNQKIWIDLEKSHGVLFETAGTDTIFRLKLIKQYVEREGETHDLYRATHCVEDHGKYISHFSTISRTTYIVGNLLSYESQEPVWINTGNAKIKTNICGTLQENIWRARIPREWENFITENFAFLEISGLPKGTKSLFRPIRPVLDEIELKTYKSAEKIEEIPIANYARV